MTPPLSFATNLLGVNDQGKKKTSNDSDKKTPYVHVNINAQNLTTNLTLDYGFPPPEKFPIYNQKVVGSVGSVGSRD